MKYYSESLHKVFDSEAELKAAEARQAKRNKNLIAAGRELTAARDNFKQAQDNCDKAREAYVEAVRKYRAILENGESVKVDKVPTQSVSDEEFQKIIKRVLAAFDAFDRR